MDKISGILPSNARLKSVDMKGAHPVRPGVPEFGQPVGSTSSMRDRISISAQNGSGPEQDLLTYKNPRDSYHSHIAEELSKRFFESRMSPPAPDAAESEFEEITASAAKSLAPNDANESSNSESPRSNLPDSEKCGSLEGKKYLCTSSVASGFNLPIAYLRRWQF